jgi:hypothetical protein
LRRRRRVFLRGRAPDRFKYKSRRNGPEAKEEVAAWKRDGLQVRTERLQTTTRVKLEWPGGGEKVVCDQEGLGDNPWADDVVRVLQGPAPAG